MENDYKKLSAVIEEARRMYDMQEKSTVMFASYPDVVNIEELREMLGGIGLTLAYRLLQEKSIHSIKIGREYKIPKSSVTTYLTRDEP